MSKKKRIIINTGEKTIVENNLNEVYIYIRDIKKLCPVPYNWVIDIKKINELKGK